MKPANPLSDGLQAGAKEHSSEVGFDHDTHFHLS